MRTILIASLLTAAAACHQNGTPREPQPLDPIANANDNYDVEHLPADPTLPSWAPRSCTAYHTAVVQLAECDAVPETSRDTVKTQYDVDHARWAAMRDESADHIRAVGDDCMNNYQVVVARNACLAQNQPRPIPR